MTAPEFRALLERLAALYRQRAYAEAAHAFAGDVCYEDPKRYRFEDRAALQAFLEADEGHPQRTVWHAVLFDEARQVGAAEYTYEGSHRYHGVALIRIAGGVIAHWREYQHVDPRPWEAFVRGGRLDVPADGEAPGAASSSSVGAERAAGPAAPAGLEAPERLTTERLLLHRPRAQDAAEIFARYASDPEITRLLGWPTHRSMADTRAFLDCCDGEWRQWPAGAYLARSRSDGTLLGSTGFSFETPSRAMTGYVLARDAWGQGFATEALGAIVAVAGGIGVRRLYALCHTGHRASWRVLEKCGFVREGILHRHTEFPNLVAGELFDVVCYAAVF